MIVVIPSNRGVNLKYLAPLIDSGARFVIVDDSEGNIRVDHPQFEVYNWNDRRKMLGALDVGFPKRNGASRDFGFYVAWKSSDPGEIIVALDDDCEVYHPDFHAQVAETLTTHARPVATCEGTHLNILDLYQGTPGDLFPRGFPYSARASYAGARLLPADERQVTFSLGLWRGIFDVNAIDKIRGPQYEHADVAVRERSVIIERDKLISVCSMNMQFRREVIPAVYQLPMHVEVLPNWVVDRYGDIWGGFILKTLMDMKNEAIAVGEPMIFHAKEGDYIRNIWQEHICHLLNDEFVELLLSVKETIRSRDYCEMMQEVAEGFERYVPSASPMLRPYLAHLCSALAAWNAALA